MRSKIVAGNWKMNKNLNETEALLKELSAKLPDTQAEVMVAPTYVNLAGCGSRFGIFCYSGHCPEYAFR